jgi:uncharacterized protein (DUF433 family)
MSLVRGVAFNNTDPRELPAYTPTEAAAYLRVPLSTLRTWVYGYTPRPKQGGRRVPPIIQVPSRHTYLLSFLNLVEGHVLSSIRREHEIPLGKIRRAVTYVEEQLQIKRPLAKQRFETDGINLFVRTLGKLINASDGGQVAFEHLLQTYLKRIEWDGQGLAMRLFPYVRQGIPDEQQPRSIMMDPTISSGRPVLLGTGIPTKVVAERYMAGESTEDLAADYGRRRAEIDEVIRFELRAA